MVSLISHTFQFLFFHVLLSFVDRITKLPRNSTPPEVMRILRENLALKAQIDALSRELKRVGGKRPKSSMQTRASQVFAFLLTRQDSQFQKNYLSASRRTLACWASKFRRGPWPWRKKLGGRPVISQDVIDLILQLKNENPLWGAKRIADELNRMGIKISRTSVNSILKEHGFDPIRGYPRSWERFKSTAKDMIWALDFFAVKTAKGIWINVLLVVDIYTKEILELRAYDGWDVDSAWTIKTFAECISREKRRPESVIHDHGVQFLGQFKRQLRVLNVDQKRTPVALPFVNGVAERTIKTARRELLNHVTVRDADELQWYLDEFREYFNYYRSHQGIEGQTPAQFAAGEGPIINLERDRLRGRRIDRKKFAKGLLNGYALVKDSDDAEPRKAA